uniref:Uncharacterized protein n=1 Tax=Candidatus Kentrum sp. DK TaxID=2126562 RepID=A0A450SX96_9GAMM|nr:MAG: hypothetical protein BECKDK2373C_GA0170839_106623 [Candidatus Kentron sp. DK]
MGLSTNFPDEPAKVGSHPLTALKTSSKCSFIPYKLHFLVSFRLVMKHDLTFAYDSVGLDLDAVMED